MSETSEFQVVVSAGTLRSANGVSMPHRWTPGGVVVDAEFTGAHLYHLAAAGCVLNDVYREAEHLGLSIAGVRVRASGAFDSSQWVSTGVEYEVDIDSGAGDDDIAHLLAVVDDVAEIPKALRSGTTVRRRGGRRAD